MRRSQRAAIQANDRVRNGHAEAPGGRLGSVRMQYFSAPRGLVAVVNRGVPELPGIG